MNDIYLYSNPEEATSSKATSSVPSESASSSTSVKGKFKPRNANQLYESSLVSGQKQIQERLDQAVLRLFCVGGIALNNLDEDEWKEIWAIGCPKYKPVSRTTMEDTLIVRRCSTIKKEYMIELV